MKLINFFCIFFLLSTISVSAQQIEKWKIDRLEKHIKEAKTPLIVNFWATFCKPCIEEIPYFQRLIKKYKSEGIELLLVSLDLKDAFPKIKEFVTKYGFSSAVVYLDETNADIFCPKVDESWSGAIPASLFINNSTGYRKFFEEQIPEKKLEQEIQAFIKK